uniref:Alpha-amylase n=1 Tax=Crangon crangon TaxID=491138 RepID=A0A2Z4BW21_CRACN|nr:putative alpha-amylase [Crangon crangon]
MAIRNIALIVIALLVSSTHAQWDPHVLENRQAMVHLFEWKYPDVAKECEDFLAPKGYGGVQVSPSSECVAVYQGQVQRPWWERYQPVSYKISSRSGDEGSFRDMVARCNDVGVRIYTDVVLNHMTGDHPAGTPTTGDSYFDSGAESYPGVPYSAFDFNDANCHTASGSIEDYSDAEQVRNCKLSGMKDLNQGKDYVREMIMEYLNRLISYGVAGFRVDASKHMWPGDLEAIFSQLDDLSTDYFPAGTRPFVVFEVIEGEWESIKAIDYAGIGRVTEFKYGRELGHSFRGFNQLKWLRNIGEDWGMLPRHESLVFIDNHDNQRTESNGVLTFRVDKWYKMATAFMLGFPYGFTRVMSSYYWDQYFEGGRDINDWTGPPQDTSFDIISPSFNPDGSCANGWICEHRWREIYNMVAFRNVVHGTDLNDWWDNGNNQIAFCRGNRGFVAINNEGADLKETLQTCLAEGTYCDVISGSKTEAGSCTGKSVQVDSSGYGYIEILNSEYDGALAIHMDSKL